MASSAGTPSPGHGDGLPPRRDPLLLRIIAMSRYAVGIAIAGTFVAATALLVHGAMDAGRLVLQVLVDAGLRAPEHAASPPMLLAISAVDAFLVAVVLYVIAAGFYQLFIHPLPLPRWLVIEDLEELELKLTGVVISVLSVVFLGQVVAWDGQRDLQGIGIATALVIAALAWFIIGRARTRKSTAT